MNKYFFHNPITNIHQKLLNQETNIYVLIDVNSDQRLRGELFNLTDAPKFHSLFHGTVLQELRDQSPFLVQIELNQYQYLSFLFEHSPEHFILIFSQHTLITLYQHWQSLLTVKTLDSDTAIYKLYTSQILGPYLDACKPYEQAQLLAFCDELYLYNEYDQWSLHYQVQPQFESSLTDLKKIDPELKTAWWQLKEIHLTYLQHITEPSLHSNMLQYLSEHFIDLLQPLKDTDISQMITHGIRRARFYEVKKRSDFAFYLGMMFDIGPDFDEHPKVNSWLISWKEKSETKDKLSTMVAQLPVKIWDEITSSSNKSAWKNMQKTYSYSHPEPVNFEALSI